MEKGKGLIKEFQNFIKRGNVIDLAVGVIIGGAFSSIVTSLVNDILTPILGIITGGHDISNLSTTFGSATLRHGAFLQNIINFFIIAICIFFMVKIINKLTKKEEKKEVVKEEIKKSDEVILLEQIRDLLKKKK